MIEMSKESLNYDKECLLELDAFIRLSEAALLSFDASKVNLFRKIKAECLRSTKKNHRHTINGEECQRPI